MTNPWLEIPLDDYEGHMSTPAIGQSALIADQLAVLIERFRPESVAVIGCAGGNGFDRVDGTRVERLVGVDINPQYVAAAANRYKDRVRGLELHVADIQSPAQIFEPVDLVYAALLFEYVQIERAMSSLFRHCRRGGVLTTLIQLPHQSVTAVSPSQYQSLQLLGPVMRLVAPGQLQAEATESGFQCEESGIVASPGGKQFALQIFRKPG